MDTDAPLSSHGIPPATAGTTNHPIEEANASTNNNPSSNRPASGSMMVSSFSNQAVVATSPTGGVTFTLPNDGNLSQVDSPPATAPASVTGIQIPQAPQQQQQEQQQETQRVRRVQMLPDGRVRLELGPQPAHVVLNRQQQPNRYQIVGNQRVITSTNGNQVNVRIVQMNPLVPQLVDPPHIATTAAAATTSSSLEPSSEWDEQMARFKCTICMEWMKAPAGCGRCASRFCHGCLMRVATNVDQQQQQRPSTFPSNLPTIAKCPTCRTALTPATIVLDDVLEQEIYAATPLPCRNEGCGQKIKLPNVQDHEKQCEYAMVKCRYVGFGCPWIGKRKDVASHEADSCSLAKVAGLVEQIRELRSDVGSRLDMIQQQTLGALRMQEVHRQTLQRTQVQSTTNVLSLIHYCHVLTCSTPHFLFTKDVCWSSYWRTPDSRAAVVNFLTFLPTNFLCMVLGHSGFRNLLMVLDDQPRESSSDRPAEHMEEVLLCLCIGVLGILLMATNIIDGRSSCEWSEFQLPLLGSQRVMRDLIAVSVFAIHLSAFGCQGTTHYIKAFVIWFLAIVVTTIFPKIVGTIAFKASASMPVPVTTTTSSTLETARSVGPVLFGLRYAFLAVVVGFIPCMDAASLMLLTQPILKQYAEELTADECFLEYLPTPFVYATAGARLAMYFIQLQNTREEPDSSMSHESMLLLVDSIVGYMLLILMNFLFGKLQGLGVYLGTIIAEQAQADVRPDGVLRKEYNLLGMACFVLWMTVCGALFHSRL